LTFAEASFTVRTPHLALSISVPATVLPSQTFQVTTTAQAETERQVWEYVMPNTGGCPANADAASRASGENEILGYWNVIGGPITETKNQSLTTLGSYLFCAYFQYPNREAVPELSASAQTRVVLPPPPCVVPAFQRGAGLASVEQSITAASCSVGKIHYTASSRVGRGGVISLSPATGTKLGTGAAVDIIVSAGRACIVPAIAAGISLAKAERQITAANCTVGAVSHVHSRRVRRGRVLSLAPRPHTRLSPRAKVRVLVSAGRSHQR
jgi:hypothetical protein